VAFWVVKAKPSRANLLEIVRRGPVGDWLTNRPPRTWKPTDWVFLWQAAPVLELRGFGTIVDVARPDAQGVTRFQIRYEAKGCRGPGIERLRADNALAGASFLKAGPAGTVFLLRATEVQPLVDELARAHLDSVHDWATAVRQAETPSIALSIRQPYTEMILRGTKTAEYRSTPTKRRGRVYIYASQKPGLAEYWERIGREPGDLLTGLVVGTVDILTCVPHETFGYASELANPRRLEHPFPPRRLPQPIWFRPV
jgi:hypothetical protein